MASARTLDTPSTACPLSRTKRLCLGRLQLEGRAWNPGVLRAQYLTLVFIGCISVSSLRAFLRNMHKVSKLVLNWCSCQRSA